MRWWWSKYVKFLICIKFDGSVYWVFGRYVGSRVGRVVGDEVYINGGDEVG